MHGDAPRSGDFHRAQRVPVDASALTGAGSRPTSSKPAAGRARCARGPGEVCVGLLVLPRVRDIRRIGSAALDLCRVADGSLDVYYERGLNVWDMAAGWLVASEAGAVVTDLTGDHPGTAMTIAGGPGNQGELRSLLARAVARVRPESAG